MRSLDERMAEISHRSAVRIKQIKKRRIGVLMTCVPVVLCVTLFLGLGIGSRDKLANAPESAQNQQLNGHGAVLETSGNTSLKDSWETPEIEETETLLEDVHYIPVKENRDDIEAPQVRVIWSNETLENGFAYESASTGEGVRYDESIFESSYLVLLRMEAAGSAVRYQVTGVEKRDGGQIVVEINRILPENETNGMCQWDIILKLKKDGETVGEEQVLVEFQ